MQRMETVKQSGPCNSLSTDGSLVVVWWLCISSRIKPENSYLILKLSSIDSKILGILTKVLCTSGPNLVILAWMGGELWGKAQNGARLDFQVKFDLEGQGRSVQKNRDLNRGLLHIWSKFGDPSLNRPRVIVRTSKWLTHTHTQTDRG